MTKTPARAGFTALLSDVRQRIQTAQTRAVLAVNSELVRLYWDIGRLIDLRQKKEGWGAGVIPRLAAELKNELPELKGFSERNIKQMLAFYREYPNPEAILQPPVAKLGQQPAHQGVTPIVPQPVAQLNATPILPPPVAKLQQQAAHQDVTPIVQPPVAQLSQHTAHQDVTPIVPQPAAQWTDVPLWDVPWAHHVVIMQKVRSVADRVWYMRQVISNGWSRNILSMQIDMRAHKRHGLVKSNFAQTLPPPQSDLVQQTLKDPYIFDFLTLEEPFHERELEAHLVRDVQQFLIELGQGFAFVGRQYRLDVGDEDFYIDLLFYHLRLRAFVVIDLKKGKFKPEYAGKLNFYCNVVNDRLKHPTDQPTIGLILCQERSRLLAEYSFAGISKPIGIATYQLTRALPKEIRSALPTVEELETELSERLKRNARPKRPPSAMGRKARGVMSVGDKQ